MSKCKIFDIEVVASTNDVPSYEAFTFEMSKSDSGIENMTSFSIFHLWKFGLLNIQIEFRH